MKLIIMGNGKKILSSKRGEFVDSCDLVVRINNFKMDGYEDFIGTKMDIYGCTHKYITSIDKTDEQLKADAELRYEKDLALNPELEQYREKYIKIYTYPKIESKRLKEVLFTHTPDNDVIKSVMIQHPEDKFPFQYLPFSDKIRICNFGTTFKHTTGFKIILYCLKQYADYEIYITGFDFYLESGWYWDMEPWMKQHLRLEGSKHCYLLEKERIGQLIKDGKIKEI